MSRPEELSGVLWPIHLKPYDDELLTSWMVRLARAYGVKPVWFWNQVWPCPQGVRWPYLNHTAPEDLLALLSEHTATPYDRVVQSTLLPLGEVQFIPHSIGGLRYCPTCLAEDSEPYFRRCWQMASFSICDRHLCYLMTDCGHCQHPLSLETIPLERDFICSCFRCSRDLRSLAFPVKATVSPLRVSQLQSWQRRLWNVVQQQRADHLEWPTGDGIVFVPLQELAQMFRNRYEERQDRLATAWLNRREQARKGSEVEAEAPSHTADQKAESDSDKERA